MRFRLVILSTCFIASACVVEDADPAGQIGGQGFTNTDGQIQLDGTQVPLVMACEAGQYVQRTADGWTCAAVTPPTWNTLDAVPSDFSDGVDNDVVSELNCADGEVPGWSAGTGTWVCRTDNDVVAGLACGDAEVAAWSVANQAWQCAGVTSAAGGDMTAVIAGAGLTGGADSGEATLAVDFGSGANQAATGESLATTQADVTALQASVMTLNGTAQALQADVTAAEGQVTTAQNNITTLQGQVTALQGETTLSDVTPCANGQVPTSNGSGGWTCQTPASGGTTLDSLSGCANGDVPKTNGAGSWSCQSDDTLDGPTVTRALTVPSTAFFPFNSSEGYGTTTGNVRWNIGGDTLAAPVFLPQGATITALFCRIQENSTTRSMKIWLRQTRPGLSNDNMIEITTGPNESNASFIGGTNGDLNSTAVHPTQNTINHTSAYFYNLFFRTYSNQTNDVAASCGSSCQVSFCRISYQVTNPY